MGWKWSGYRLYTDGEDCRVKIESWGNREYSLGPPAIREKYNVVTGSDEAPVLAGYHENLIGFGWTNGTFLALYHALPPDQQKKVLQGTGTAKAN